MKDLYSHVASQAGIDRNDTVLVVCGGEYDKKVILSLGVINAVISNLDYSDGITNTDYAPLKWMSLDAENLNVDDNSFDWVVVHAGLHHCRSPHRAMCEMLRVARKGILVVEARDSLLVNIAVALGFTSDYEVESAILSGGKSGGCRNTKIPNYIYRWTEREVEKTVNSFLPQWRHIIRYFYGYRIPTQRFTMSKSKAKRLIVALIDRCVLILEIFLPKQGNFFAFVVTKGGALHPWLKTVGGSLEVDLELIGKKYDPKAYLK